MQKAIRGLAGAFLAVFVAGIVWSGGNGIDSRERIINNVANEDSDFRERIINFVADEDTDFRDRII